MTDDQVTIPSCAPGCEVRIEHAPPEDQRMILILAWDAIYPTSMCWDFDEGLEHERLRSRFFNLLDAGGFLDAAILLIPKDAKYRLDSHYGIATVYVYHFADSRGPDCYPFEGEGSTMALSLLAAIFRARQCEAA